MKLLLLITMIAAPLYCDRGHCTDINVIETKTYYDIHAKNRHQFFKELVQNGPTVDAMPSWAKLNYEAQIDYALEPLDEGCSLNIKNINIKFTYRLPKLYSSERFSRAIEWQRLYQLIISHEKQHQQIALTEFSTFDKLMPKAFSTCEDAKDNFFVFKSGIYANIKMQDQLLDDQYDNIMEQEKKRISNLIIDKAGKGYYVRM